MKRNTVVLQDNNIIINDVNYQDLHKYSVEGQVVFASEWEVTNRGLAEIFGEPQPATISELEVLNTSWGIELPVGTSGVNVHCQHGADMAALCRAISAKHGVAMVSSAARYLMRCQDGSEIWRKTLDEFYDNITEEDLEATRFF